MTIEEIKQLIQVVLETGIAELEVKQGENSVHIRSTGSRHQDVVLPTVLPLQVQAAPSMPSPNSISAPQISTPSEPSQAPNKEDENIAVVKAPIVGTFYDAPAPGADPFVKVGDLVRPKQVLCIIESMKLMNEIEAEIAGTIISKHVESGRPVEYGESLFTIRPA